MQGTWAAKCTTVLQSLLTMVFDTTNPAPEEAEVGPYNEC